MTERERERQGEGVINVNLGTTFPLGFLQKLALGWPSLPPTHGAWEMVLNYIIDCSNSALMSSEFNCILI